MRHELVDDVELRRALVTLDTDEIFLVAELVLEAAFGGCELRVAEIAPITLLRGRRRQCGDLNFGLFAPRYHRHAQSPFREGI